MIWLTFAAILIALLCVLKLIRYRKQIRLFAQDLQFIRTNNSNQLLTLEDSYTEVRALAYEINELNLQHKKLEQEVINKEEVLKCIITSLSHDIRTPLTSLDGYFQLLKSCEEENERERYYQIIHGRIESLRCLLEELFTYMKLQNDSYRLEVQPCNITKILFDSMFHYYDEFNAKGIQPLIHLTEQQCMVHSNEVALRRIFQNIVKNVLEHGKNKFIVKSELLDKIFMIEFRNDCSEDTFIDIAQVFHRFYKADESRTHISSGLGLSITKELVEKLYGQIEAKMEQQEFIIRIQFPIL